MEQNKDNQCSEDETDKKTTVSVKSAFFISIFSGRDVSRSLWDII